MNNFKLLAIIAIAMFMPMQASAQTWVNEFPIYYYGDVSFLGTIYEYISAVAQSDTVHYIIAFAISIALTIAGWQIRSGASIGSFLTTILIPIGSYAFFLYPGVTVHIIDERMDKGIVKSYVPSGGYILVEKVPYAIAFIPASSSLIVEEMIRLIDDNWAGVATGNKFGTQGFQKMSDVSQKTLALAKLNDVPDGNASEAAYYAKEYINACIVSEALKIPQNKAKVFSPSKPYPAMFDPVPLSINTKSVSFHKYDGSSDYQTCQYIYDHYFKDATYVAAITAYMEEKASGANPNIDVTSVTFNEAWREQTGDALLNRVGTISKAAATTSMSRLLEGELSVEGIGINGTTVATESAIQSSIANLRSEGPAKFEWLIRMVPDGLSIIMGIVIAAFPLFVISLSFMGRGGVMAIANYFMGYVALNFNLVSLALVHNIMSFYTAQHAQEAISSLGEMPYGLSHVTDFMAQQADMAGLAGLIGAASIFAVTPLIFKGETAGLQSALGALGGAFSGNIEKTALENLKNYDLQRTLEEDSVSRSLTMSEGEASKRLSEMGIRPMHNMSSLQAYNDILRGIGMMGAGIASEQIHNNSSSGKIGNYITGNEAMTSQSFNKTAGFGSTVNLQSAGDVSFQDGEVMGEQVNATDSMRKAGDYNTKDIGTGQAAAQFAKEMGDQLTGREVLNNNALPALVANSTLAANSLIAAGKGNLKTGAFNSDGTIDPNNQIMNSAMVGAALQSAGKLMNLKGMGDSVDKSIESNGFDDFMKGSEFQGRTNANKTIADGEKWKDLGDDDNDPDKVALMKKVKENENVGTFGGINATNAEIHKHKDGVEGAIADMITGAQEKGIQSAIHASNLRDKYGAHLDSVDRTDGSGKKLAEVVQAMDKGKLDSDATSVAEGDKSYAGHGGFAGLQSDAAKVKTKQLAGSITGQMQVANNIEGQQEFINKALAGAANEEQRKAMLHDLQKSGWTDANGKVNEGAFIKAKAMLSANNMMSSNSMGIGGSVVSGSIGGTGVESTVKVDGQDVVTQGKKFDAGIWGLIEENLDGARAAERAQFAMNPKKWVEGIASKGHDAGVGALELMGFDKEEAESMYETIAAPAVGVAGATAIAEVASRIAGKGSLVGKTYTGTKDYLSGQNSKSNQQSVDTASNSNNSQTDSKVNNESQHETPPNSDKESVTENLKSDNIEKINDKISMVKNTDNSTAGRAVLDNAIENQLDKTAPDSKEYKALMRSKNALDTGKNVHVGALKEGGFTTEQLQGLGIQESKTPNGRVVDFDTTGQIAKDTTLDRLNGDLKAATLSAPTPTSSGTVLDRNPSEKGFFAKRIEAASEAIHDGGSWKTKLGLAASAMVLGTASDTFAQGMQAIDLTSYLVGSDVGGGDVKYANLSGSMFKNNNNIPTHVQNAFSQPTGTQNTYSGGSNAGVSAYSGVKQQANSDAMVDTMADVRLGFDELIDYQKAQEEAMRAHFNANREE